MKRLPILMLSLLLLVISPLVIYAQDIGIEYSHNKFITMDQKTLQNKLIGTNIGTTLSVALLAGGIIATGLGAYSGLGGTLIVFSGSPIGVLIGGLAIAGGVIISCAGVTAGVIAYRSIENLSDRKDKIKIALKQFKPVSYYDKPGIGIGISIPLN
jgi:hypothetical protein